MKSIVVFYSNRGNNKYLSKKIKEKAGSDIFEILEVKKSSSLGLFMYIILRKKAKLKEANIDLSKYDHVIFAAPIWASGIAMPLLNFIEKEKGKVKSYSFATLCLGTPRVEEKAKKQISTLIGKDPVAITVLKYNDVLPEKEKNTIKASNNYMINDVDYEEFKEQVDRFLSEVKGVIFQR
ncbi:MAG: flavodoxin domain-containing protein [bacterium]